MIVFVGILFHSLRVGKTIDRVDKVTASTESVVTAVITAIPSSGSELIISSKAKALVVKPLAVKTPVVPIDADPNPSPLPTPKPESGLTPFPPLSGDNTVGCQFPPVYDKWWLQPTDQYAYLTGLEESEEYRTNVMFNWEGHFQHTIEAVSQFGVVLGSASFDTYMLEPCTPDNVTYNNGTCSGMFQINKFVTHVNSTYVGKYSIRIKPLGGTGRIFFYATLIDNKSDDCTTLTQFRSTKNNNVWAESGLYFIGSANPEDDL